MAKRITVEATAYGPPWNAMEGTGITSTGVNLQKGKQKLVVAVDPRVIPYGTKLRIPNNPFGDPDLVFTASDTGGAIKGNRIDFFVASGRERQNRWGRRNTQVEILGRGSPKDVAILGSPGARTQTRSGPVKQTGAVAGGSDLQAQARRQAAAQWLLSSSKSTADLQNRVAEAEASVPVSTPTAAKTPTTVRRQGDGSTPLASAAKQRADQIDSKKLPYKWGGGHGGKVDPATATPLDCSGAVSAVIGINPRVSGQFQSWGRPGRAPGGKGVTIYSNAEHVLMEIDGRFWGTSKSNPGGGAGWIPRSQVSASYLSRFTARHSRR